MRSSVEPLRRVRSVASCMGPVQPKRRVCAGSWSTHRSNDSVRESLVPHTPHVVVREFPLASAPAHDGLKPLDRLVNLFPCMFGLFKG